MPRVLIPKVRFNLNQVENGEGYVLAIFRYQNGALRFHPGAKVEVRYWDTKAQRAKYTPKHPEYPHVNQLLNEVDNVITGIYWETKGGLSVEDFRKEALYRLGRLERPKDETITTLTEFANKYVDERKSALEAKRGTWKILQTVAGYLEDFSQTERFKMEFDNINHNFFNRFKNWMYSPPREFSANYAGKVLGVIRQFLIAAKNQKLHDNEAYKDFSIKKTDVTHIALSWEELRVLYDLNLSANTRLERVRDLFLIGCFTGLRYSDFSRIKPENFIEVEGEKMLEITTQKTGDRVTIPFNPELSYLLAKYDFSPPKISGQKMNDYLKELGELAGITEKILVITNKAGKRVESQVEKFKLITTHVARRSFATNLFLLGVPAINIMKITGHSTEKQFMGYIRVDGRKNAQHMAKEVALRMKERLGQDKDQEKK
jgi:integrase